MLTAVVAIAAFAYIAFEVMAANRGAIVGLSAQIDRARMEQAADAALALAVAGVAAEDPAHAWPIDGRSQSLGFDGMDLTVAVEDERGKAPINRLNEAQLRRLFTAAGAEGERLTALVVAFQDWKDPDDSPRLGGAENADYATDGIAPRNGDVRNLAELTRLKGMDRDIHARLTRLSTVFFGLGGFSRETASPEVLGIMFDDPAIADSAGQRNRSGSAPESAEASRLGRPMTVRVGVDDGRGGRLSRTAMIELTGDPTHPYWVRSSD